MIWKLKVAACLSFSFIPILSLRVPNSFKTSWGTIHSIGSDVILFVFSWMSIFCFAVVIRKFVSSRICMRVGC